MFFLEILQPGIVQFSLRISDKSSWNSVFSLKNNIEYTSSLFVYYVHAGLVVWIIGNLDLIVKALALCLLIFHSVSYGYNVTTTETVLLNKMVTFLEMKKLMAIDKKCLIFFMKRTIFEWGAALQKCLRQTFEIRKVFYCTR